MKRTSLVLAAGHRLGHDATVPRLLRVTVRCAVATVCPNGGTDETEVTVTWVPIRHVEVEEIQGLVGRHAGETIWCEDLALAVATSTRPLVGGTVRVVARQLVGHGVEAEAEA